MHAHTHRNKETEIERDRGREELPQGYMGEGILLRWNRRLEPLVVEGKDLAGKAGGDEDPLEDFVTTEISRAQQMASLHRCVCTRWW